MLILWGAVIEHGFSGQSWLTFRQALGLGGHVRKGERGTTVVYADRFTPDDEKSARRGDRRRGAVPSRFSSVLPSSTRTSAMACPRGSLPRRPPPPPGQIEPTSRGVDRRHRHRISASAARAPTTHRPSDFVQVPPPAAYFEPINWHRTAFHELGHWTGHASRLNRDQIGFVRLKKYALEELVAEMSGRLRLRLARYRADRAPRRLHRFLAGGAARGQSRRRACRERGDRRPPISCSASAARDQSVVEGNEEAAMMHQQAA